jgi:hypothetical protein
MVFNQKKLLFLLMASSLLVVYHKFYTMDDLKMSSLSVLADAHQVKPEVCELLKHSGIDAGNSLDEIVRATQKAQGAGGWMRKAGAERWQIDELEKDSQETAQLLTLFSKLNMIEEIQPNQQHYTYAVLAGATAERVRSRFAHLIYLWKQGVRFDTLVVLGGERDLDPQLENEKVLFEPENSPLAVRTDWVRPVKIPATEFEMMKMVIDQAVSPADLKLVPITYINAPKVKTDTGALRRPNTSDTIKEWLATGPTPGSVLLISNQPYVGYQHACMKTYVPSEFVVETVGESASSQEKLAILFDTLARWLYQEQEYLKTKE